LSHFRNIQETNNILSDSMSFSQHQLSKQPSTTIEQPQQSSYESSPSLTNKGLNLPTNSTPLHNTESVAIHPTAMPPCHRRHSSCQTFHSRSIETLNDDEFFSYPRGQPHYQLTARLSEDIVTLSPLKNRQAPPPPPPKLPTRRTGSSGAIDDDDSLVFKMSELSGYEDTATAVPTTEEGFYYGEMDRKEDFLQRLKNATKVKVTSEEEGGIMRRALSSEAVADTVTIEDALSDSSSKSDPVRTSRYKAKLSQQKQEGTNLTRRLFFGEL
jgi:hypothetical protein